MMTSYGSGTALVEPLDDNGTATDRFWSDELKGSDLFFGYQPKAGDIKFGLPHVDENGHVPPAAGELRFPHKIGNARIGFNQVAVKNCPRGRM